MERLKWYNSRVLIEILLFILPPLGLYALYRNKSIKSGNIKILYAAIGFITGVILLVICLKDFRFF